MNNKKFLFLFVVTFCLSLMKAASSEIELEQFEEGFVVINWEDTGSVLEIVIDIDAEAEVEILEEWNELEVFEGESEGFLIDQEFGFINEIELIFDEEEFIVLETWIL